MLELFAPLIADVVIQGSRETAGHARDRVAHERQTRLAAELQSYMRGSHRVVTQFLTALTEKNFSARETDDLMLFLRSDPGLESIRLVAISALAPSSDPYEREGLARMVAAKYYLHKRQEATFVEDAAQLLVRTIFRVLEQMTFEANKTPTGTEAMRRAKEEARWARFDRSLLTKQALTRRYDLSRDIAEHLPENYSEMISDYCREAIAETAQIVVPTLGSALTAPIDQAYIPARLAWNDKEPEGQLLEESMRWRRVVLLGDPGAGKSTAIQHAMHEWAKGALSDRHGVVPLRVVLRHYSRGSKDGFVNHMQASFLQETSAPKEATAVIRYLLTVGRAAVLFDGLDEILDADTREQVVTQIKKFVNAFPSAIAVVSSREVGYDDVFIEDFRSPYSLMPFDEDDSYRYVDRFISLQGDGSHEFTARSFMDETRELVELRRNPLMLGVLCTLYTQGRQLPINREELYRKCSEMLFEAWDKKKNTVVPLINQRAAAEVTRILALRVFQSGKEEFTQQWLEGLLAEYYRNRVSESLVEAERFATDCFDVWKGRAWLLAYVGTERGRDTYRFAHRSFLEYFAAQRLVFENRSMNSLAEALAPYVAARTGVQFSLLCLEIAGGKFDGESDSLMDEVVRRCGQTDSVQHQFNVLVWLVEGLLCTQGEWSSRRTHIEQAWVFIAELLPVLPVSRTSPHIELPSIGYLNVLDDKELNFDLEFPEPEQFGLYVTAGFVTVQELLRVVRLVSGLAPVEVSAALDLLPDIVNRIELTSGEVASMRFLSALQQAPVLESWQDVPASFSAELSDRAETLWNARAARCHETHVEAWDDFWVRLQLARSAARGWVDLIARTGRHALFTTGWPYPVISNAHTGALAHHLVVRLLGGTFDGVMAPLASDDVRQFALWYRNGGMSSLTNFDATDVSSFEPFLSTGLSFADAKTIGPWECLMCVDLLYQIRRCGDGRFVEEVRSAAVRSGSGAQMVFSTLDRVLGGPFSLNGKEAVRLGFRDQEWQVTEHLDELARRVPSV